MILNTISRADKATQQKKKGKEGTKRESERERRNPSRSQKSKAQSGVTTSKRHKNKSIMFRSCHESQEALSTLQRFCIDLGIRVFGLNWNTNL
jgi:microsomal dipeptidase-like Zn-dependent dipeptidase